MKGHLSSMLCVREESSSLTGARQVSVRDFRTRRGTYTDRVPSILDQVSQRLVCDQAVSAPKRITIPFCVDRRNDSAMEAI